jgi:hypothetical protein
MRTTGVKHIFANNLEQRQNTDKKSTEFNIVKRLVWSKYKVEGGSKPGGRKMRAMEALHHHKTHKYTITGLLTGGMLLLVSLANYRLLEDPRINPLSVYITLVPGIALILRSLRPPIGIIRVFTVLAGGILTGAVPILYTQEDVTFKWASLVALVLGAALLGGSFTPVAKTEYHKSI